MRTTKITKHYEACEESNNPKDLLCDLRGVFVTFVVASWS